MGSMYDWNLVNIILFDGIYFKKKLIFLYYILEERNWYEKYDLCNNYVY